MVFRVKKLIALSLIGIVKIALLVALTTVGVLVAIFQFICDLLASDFVCYDFAGYLSEAVTVIEEVLSGGILYVLGFQRCFLKITESRDVAYDKIRNTISDAGLEIVVVGLTYNYDDDTFNLLVYSLSEESMVLLCVLCSDIIKIS